MESARVLSVAEIAQRLQEATAPPVINERRLLVAILLAGMVNSYDPVPGVIIANRLVDEIYKVVP